jgi:hypothetical protein
MAENALSGVCEGEKNWCTARLKKDEAPRYRGAMRTLTGWQPSEVDT